ncbi:MAG: hypothetical protein Ct9H90mP21_0380 [Methanobacteriota archaeon]|nr:MAG: hypothetical protein Ct9H90mP21_0380 [Euryarchaeota archaeon]
MSPRFPRLNPEYTGRVFKCESCGHDIEIDQENERELKEPLNCPQALGGCGSTKAETRFDLVLLSSRMVNNQWIEIQEQPEYVPSGAQPRRGMVLIEGDPNQQASSGREDYCKRNPGCEK